MVTVKVPESVMQHASFEIVSTHLKWVPVDAAARAQMQQIERFHVDNDIPVHIEWVQWMARPHPAKSTRKKTRKDFSKKNCAIRIHDITRMAIWKVANIWDSMDAIPVISNSITKIYRHPYCVSLVRLVVWDHWKLKGQLFASSQTEESCVET